MKDDHVKVLQEITAMSAEKARNDVERVSSVLIRVITYLHSHFYDYILSTKAQENPSSDVEFHHRIYKRHQDWQSSKKKISSHLSMLKQMNELREG